MGANKKSKFRQPFTCAGCGAKKVPDGTPKNAPFVWYSNDAKKIPTAYCYDCDGLLLQDQPLPNDKK